MISLILLLTIKSKLLTGKKPPDEIRDKDKLNELINSFLNGGFSSKGSSFAGLLDGDLERNYHRLAWKLGFVSGQLSRAASLIARRIEFLDRVQ